MTKSQIVSLSLALALALLLSGCSSPPPMRPPDSLDPTAPAAAGLPPIPGPTEPAPLTARPPFGLYAEEPNSATLTKLAMGRLSPDGRFRASMTDQGGWVARVDGAWLWQITLPPPPPPPPPAAPPTGTPGATTPPPPVMPTTPPTLASLEWTPLNRLLLRDTAGVVYEAEAEWARVTLMPAALQGKERLTFSPDGSQVLYYINGVAGKELWLAQADGSQPKLLGANMTGAWDSDSTPILVKPATPFSPTGPREHDSSIISPLPE